MKVAKRFASSPELRQIKQLIDDGALRSLSGRYEVGRFVEALIPSDRRSYGEREFIKLTQLVGFADGSNSLAMMRNFAKMHDASEVRQLEKPLHGSDYRLSWSLIQRLLSFPPDQRRQLTKACRQGEWTVAELDRRIRAIRSRRHKGGPRLKRPRGVIDALLQAQIQAEDWLKRSQELWIAGDEPAVTAEAIRAGGAEAARVAEETAVVLDRLRAVVESFQQVLHAAKSRSRRVTKRST